MAGAQARGASLRGSKLRHASVQVGRATNRAPRTGSPSTGVGGRLQGHTGGTYTSPSICAADHSGPKGGRSRDPRPPGSSCSFLARWAVLWASQQSWLSCLSRPQLCCGPSLELRKPRVKTSKARKTALACLKVFALGGRSSSQHLHESGYFAVRAAMARSVTQAVQMIAGRGVTDESASAIVRLLSQIGARYDVVVSPKIAAQAVPVLGALSGAALSARSS